MAIRASTRAGLHNISAWCGIVYVLILIFGWGLIGGFLPPHSPSASAETITQIFRENTLNIRIANILVMIAALVLIPFIATIAEMVGRIEGRCGVLTICTIMGGAGTMILTFYPAIWWLVAAFRPEIDPGIIRMLNDMAWLQFIGGVTMYLALPLGMGVAILCDNSAEPMFPRWSGYANLWLMLLVVPDQLLFFFHNGPFAWDGIFGLWVPLIGFAAWFGLAFYLIRLAAGRASDG